MGSSFQKKLKKLILTREEWNDALRVPKPYRDKSKYYRKKKHKNRLDP